MELYEINPHIRYGRIHKASFKVRTDISICYDARLFFFENTEGTITVNGKKYQISNKTAVYLPPLQRYRINVDFKDETRVIIIDFDLITKYSDIKSSLGTANPQNFAPELSPKYELPSELQEPIIKPLPEITQFITQCANNFSEKNPLYRERSSAFLKLCILELISQSIGKTHSELCTKILNYIHENYADLSLTNEQIAEKFNYHPYHLNRVIKRETGKSLRTYIIYYRLEMAKNYLLTTSYNISEIAFRTGFCSSAHFIKIFREKNGMTPRDYRSHRLHNEI